MIIINLPTDDSLLAQAIRKQVGSCPRHVWTLRSRWCPIWSCEHCGVEGRIK